VGTCRSMTRFLVCPLIWLAMVAGFAGPAKAELAALVHDTENASLRVVRIDSSDGSVTTGTESVAACCFISSGMTASDGDSRRFFAYGLEIDEGNPGAPVLLELGFDGNSVSTTAPARSPEGVLAYDSAGGRLIAFEFSDDFQNPSLQLIAIDPTSGAVSDLGPENLACCEVITGTHAIDSAAQRLFFVGREFGATDWSIQSISLADASLSVIAPMPAAGRPGFLSLNEAGTELDVYLQEAMAGAAGVYRVNVGTGVATEVSVEADPGCCLVGPGETVGRDQAGLAWWMAGSGSGVTPASGFMALPTGDDVSSVPSQTMASGYELHALVVDGQVINPFLLFRDRFEL